MTERVKDSFIVLLRMGLWGESCETLPYFPLSNAEWSLIYEISVSQTVEGVVYEGLLLLPQEYLPPYAILLRWTAKIDGVERYNKSMRQNLGILAGGLAKNNINYILLKGLGLAYNYNKPLLRVSGDVDLYFPTRKDYQQANELLKSKGCQIQKGDHDSVFYNFNTIQIEHHTKMIDVFNPFCQKFIKNFIQKEQSQNRHLDLDGVKVTMPSYILSQVQTNAHILKHYLGFGVGLRQFCDVARLCHAKDQNFDGEELRIVYKKLGLSKWMNVVHNFMVNELGLHRSKLPYAIEKKYDTNSILQDVLNSGNFGFHDVRFNNSDRPISERNYKRNFMIKRIMPHIAKLINLAPSEVFWYPVQKVYSRLSGR